MHKKRVRSSVGEHLLDAQGVVRSIRTEPTIKKFNRSISGFFILNFSYFSSKGEKIQVITMFDKVRNVLDRKAYSSVWFCIQIFLGTYNSSTKKGVSAMTETIKIGATKHIGPIYKRLLTDAAFLKERGIIIDLSVSKDGDYDLIECRLDIETAEPSEDDDRGFAICCHHIAEAVADVIAVWWKPELVKEIMTKRYHSLSNAEIEHILQKMLRTEKEQFSYLQCKTGPTWKREIATRASDFLELGNIITIDGFINFRLKDYLFELERLVDEAVEDYLLEKEYDDFIDLLRYFVDTQEPRLDKVHVMFGSSGIFGMYDQNYKMIDNDFLEGFILDLMDNDLSYEDLLVSALITIAPTEIVMHLPGPIEEMSSAVSTIQSVFDERVTICVGCSKCLNFMITNS